MGLSQSTAEDGCASWPVGCAPGPASVPEASVDAAEPGELAARRFCGFCGLPGGAGRRTARRGRGGRDRWDGQRPFIPGCRGPERGASGSRTLGAQQQLLPAATDDPLRSGCVSMTDTCPAAGVARVLCHLAAQPAAPTSQPDTATRLSQANGTSRPQARPRTLTAGPLGTITLRSRAEHPPRHVGAFRPLARLPDFSCGVRVDPAAGRGGHTGSGPRNPGPMAGWVGLRTLSCDPPRMDREI